MRSTAELSIDLSAQELLEVEQITTSCQPGNLQQSASDASAAALFQADDPIEIELTPDQMDELLSTAGK